MYVCYSSNTLGACERRFKDLKPQHTRWPTLSCAYIRGWEEKWESRTFIIIEEGEGACGDGGALCEEGWEPCLVHWVHWKGPTDSAASYSLFHFLPPSLSAVVDLNNSSHIIYLYLSISFTLFRARTHADTCNYLHPHTNTHLLTCLKGLGPGAGVEWASWNLHRGKPDRHSLCQTHEVTPTDWSCQPVSIPPLYLVCLTNQL